MDVEQQQQQQQETRKETAGVQTTNNLPVSEKKQSSDAMKNLAVVQCDGFRCLAYRDGDAWRDFQSGKPLPDVKHVVFAFSV
jgi:hypothetical protein